MYGVSTFHTLIQSEYPKAHASAMIYRIHHCGDVLADSIHSYHWVHARSSLFTVMLDDYSTESAYSARLEEMIRSDQLAAVGRNGSIQAHLAALNEL